MKKFITMFCLITISSLLLLSCSKGDTTKEQPSGKNESDEEVNIYPFTGLETSGEVNQRAVAVMINNHPKARPQSGLQKADIVYEMLAEGEVTRFLAIYQSEYPDRVGPVRSARSYYIELAEGLDCIYVCHGNSPDAKQILDQNKVDVLNGLYYDGTLFKRDKSRKAPHNSYITFKNIVKGAKDNGYKLTGKYDGIYSFFDENEVQSLTGDSATTIDISYGSDTFDVTYEFDSSIDRYKRYSAGEQTIDEDTEEFVLIDNIAVLEAKHETIDSEGRRNIDLKSGGTGYLFQKGVQSEIEWENVDDVLVLTKNGQKVNFVPGKTWINIVPDDPGISSSVNIK